MVNLLRLYEPFTFVHHAKYHSVQFSKYLISHLLLAEHCLFEHSFPIFTGQLTFKVEVLFVVDVLIKSCLLLLKYRYPPFFTQISILGVHRISKCSSSSDQEAKMEMLFRSGICGQYHGRVVISPEVSIYFPTVIGPCTQSQAVRLASSQILIH